MQKNDRTLWSEGMFLGPQHFQQHDRFLLNTISLVVRGMGRNAHGLIDYEMDAHALEQGKFALKSLSGLFPDGTPFNLPEDGQLPTPVLIDSDCHDTVISLAIPFADQQDKDAVETAAVGSFSRYLIGDKLVSDRHTPDSDTEEVVFTASLWTRLSIAAEDETAFHTIPLVRVLEKRNDDRVILDDKFYPCAMSLQASTPLQTMTRELEGVISHRAADLANSIGTATAADSVQLTQLLLLQTLNRASPLLKHINESSALHPEELYRDLIQLAGDLSTITQPQKRPPEFCVYLHRDQYKSFAPLFDYLRQCINWVADVVAESFSIEHVKAGLYSVSVNNLSLFQTSRFILAAKAQVTPDELSKRLPRQITLSSSTKLRGLVEAQARGVALRPVITLPNSIPMYENQVYFEMREDDPLWQDIALSGDISMYISGNFSDLQMQLWAVRK